MPLPEQKFREIVFQLLYSNDFATLDEEEAIPFLMSHCSITKKSMRLACERQKNVLGKQDGIDQLISEASHAYDFHRIPRVERTILRLAIFEILYDDAVPYKVAMAEAIRLCRKFATPEASTFINAILDTIYQKSKSE